MSSQAAEDQLVGEVPRHHGAVGQDMTIGARFSSQAARQGDAPAFRSPSETLSYAELEWHSNAVAQLVAAACPGSGARIAIRMGFGAKQAAALLGVFKSGHTAVMLDGQGPVAEARALLADAGASLLLVDDPQGAEFVSGAHPGFRARWAVIETASGPCAYECPADLRTDSAACIVYTSGSTGRPKGVVRSHANLVWNADIVRTADQFQGMESFCFVSSLHTGNGISNLLRCLLGGITSAPFNLRENRLDGLYDWLRQTRAAGVTLPASVLRHVVHTLPAGARLDNLRFLRISSEPVHRQDYELFRRHFGPDAHLVNALSSTETGPICREELGASPVFDGDRVPVGRPLPGVTVEVLDESGAPCPEGVAGRMAIESPGVGSGYWGQPELTSRHFEPGRQGCRRFLSGDLAIRRDDGRIVHAGRSDRRVKIRGLGVDLGGIESTLTQHPGVRTAAVSVRSLPGKDAQLVAWFESHQKSPPGSTELRRFLRHRLSEASLPAIFIEVEALPRSANGKLDRQAIEALPLPVSPPETPGRAPSTETEITLARIWQDVLSHTPPTLETGFYECGGHSLAAMRVLARVESTCGVRIRLRDFLENPTLGWLAGQVDDLPAKAGSTAAGRDDRISPRDPGLVDLPASPGQQQLWFLERLNPGSTAYVLPWALHFRGPLDATALQKSLELLVRRHETLRTRFRESAGEVRQVIQPPGGTCLQHFDLSGLPAGERESAWRRHLKEDSHRPFDLPAGPPWRATLVRCSDSEHVFSMTMHHILGDRWSKWVLIGELAAGYAAFAAGNAAAPGEPPVQFADVCLWNSQERQAARCRDQLDYWRRRLADLPSLELPTDLPRPDCGEGPAAVLESTLPHAVLDGLRALAATRGASLYATALAVFQVLIHRFSGATDFAIGTAVANRRHVDLERVIGFLANTVALRSTLSPSDTFHEHLATTARQVLEDLDHQEVPLERVVRELRPPRATGRHPFFEVMFTLQNVPRAPLHFPGLEARPVGLRAGDSKFDLVVTAFEGTGGLQLRWEYRSDLFDAATIQGLAETYATLAAAAIADPATPVSRLPLAISPDTHNPSLDPNALDSGYPRDALLHELFDEQAGIRPDAVAVVTDAGRFTYRELRAHADEFAWRLVEAGVHPGDFVGLHLHRSVEHIVAVLAVLKAGAAYVTLPMDFPPERLSWMLGNASIRHAVAAAPPDWLSAQSECLAPPNLASPHRTAPLSRPTRVTAMSPSCVFYTSGTTGTPGGAVVPHRAVVRLVRGTTYLPWGPDLRILLASPIAFDAFQFELWGALLVGGSVAVYPEGPADLGRLDEFVARHQVTTAFLTTALFHQVVELRPSLLQSLSQLLVGGETLSPSHARRALESSPHLELSNVYGPTECSTFSTAYRVPAVTGTGALRPVPIGRPLANTRCVILDEHGAAVPAGFAGELFIGGDALALGYVNDPARTARQFVKDPLCPGQRLYRTGDRCRWSPDGNILFLGRMDGQLKVRGFRVEPGEVEAAILRHPAVEQAAVVGAPAADGTLQLVAHVVPRKGFSLEPAAVSTHLRALLPPPFVPSRVVLRESLPHNANGKVDRRALAAELPATPAARPVTAPSNPTEQRVLDILRRLLSQPGLGMTDDFFENGGHSLLALRLVAALEVEFNRRLSLSDLMAGPNAMAIASRFPASGRDTPDSRREIVHPGAAPLFHIPGRFGIEFLTGTVGATLRSLRPCIDTLEFPGVTGSASVPHDGRLIAADLVRQIHVLHPQGAVCLSGHSWGGVMAFEVACQLVEAGRQVEMVILFDSLVPGSSGRRSWTGAAALLAQRTQGLPFNRRLPFLAALIRNKAAGTAARFANRDAPVHSQTTTEATGTERMELWRATEQAFRTLRPRPFDGRVVLLRATARLAHESIRTERHPTNGWDAFARGRFDVKDVPTFHAGVFKDPVHPRVPEILREVLGTGVPQPG